jgi:hypothetical protein
MFESIKNFFTKSVKNTIKNFEKAEIVEDNNQCELNTNNTFTSAEIIRETPKIKQLKKKYKNSAKYS